jgi:hypothetical protein
MMVPVICVFWVGASVASRCCVDAGEPAMASMLAKDMPDDLGATKEC